MSTFIRQYGRHR